MKRTNLGKMAVTILALGIGACGQGEIEWDSPTGLSTASVKTSAKEDASKTSVGKDDSSMKNPDDDMIQRAPKLFHPEKTTPDPEQPWEYTLKDFLRDEYGAMREMRSYTKRAISVDSHGVTRRVSCVGWNRSISYRAILTLKNERGQIMGRRVLNAGEAGFIEHESFYPEEDQYMLDCRLQLIIPFLARVDSDDADLSVYLGYTPWYESFTANEWLLANGYFLPDHDYDGQGTATEPMHVEISTSILRENPELDCTVFNRSYTESAKVVLLEGDGVIDSWERRELEGLDYRIEIAEFPLAPREIQTVSFDHVIRYDRAYYILVVTDSLVYRDSDLLTVAIGYKSDDPSPAESDPPDSPSSSSGTNERTEMLFRQIVPTGPVPFTTTFPAFGSITGELTDITMPDDLTYRYGVVQVKFPKRGYSTADCGDEDAIVSLFPGESTSDSDPEAIFGRSRPPLPVSIAAVLPQPIT